MSGKSESGKWIEGGMESAVRCEGWQVCGGSGERKVKSGEGSLHSLCALRCLEQKMADSTSSSDAG